LGREVQSRRAEGGGPGGVTEASRERRAGQAGRVDRGGPWKGIGSGRAGGRGGPRSPSHDSEGPSTGLKPGGSREGGALGAAKPQGPTQVK
jgi:hypothetical protein